jgi:protein SCO1
MDLQRFKVYRIFVIFLILVLPIIVLLCMNRGKNVYKDLPYLGNPRGLTESGDTIRHTIPSFNFTDQDGKNFGSDDLKGKIYIAEFFFTSCPTICPLLAGNLKKVNEAYQAAKDVHIVSITLDPETDSVKQLKEYADKNDISSDKWHLLTGPKEAIYNLINEKGFLLLKPEPNADPYRFKHTEMLTLVDKEGHIRGQYDGTNDKEIEKLMDEIRVLLIKYENNKSK